MKIHLTKFLHHALTLAAVALISFVVQPSRAASWTTNAPMTTARYGHTATLLQNGNVLLAGGHVTSGITNSAELYDPATGACALTGAMNGKRASHTATLLPNGQVLVAGGDNPAQLPGAELYDPLTGLWTNTPPMASARIGHTATLLPNGQVLVAGGAGVAPSAELFDPATGAWSATGELNIPRESHTATLLTNGLVLVAGGFPVNQPYPIPTSSVELYDPSSGTWALTNALNVARYAHTATLLPNGLVFVAGGANATNIFNSVTLSNAEIFNPITGTWTMTNVLKAARVLHSATLLPNGQVLLAGGSGISAAGLYDPATGTNTTTASMHSIRSEHTATLLPNGNVLVTGGQGGSAATNSTEVYDYASGTWINTGSMVTTQAVRRVTLLPDGHVLAFGSDVELYNPASGMWTVTNGPIVPRNACSVTLLANGKVLFAGGFQCNGFDCSPISSAELYDPTTGNWSATGSLNIARNDHLAVLLSNGKVLIAGGSSTNGQLFSAELFDPLSGTWTETGAPSITPKAAVRLANGKVLIVDSANAQFYDPASGTWATTGSLITPRNLRVLTLLPNGKVLIEGGTQTNTFPPVSLSSAELYDPAAETWTATGSLNTLRNSHIAVLLRNEKVLVAGGERNTGGPSGTILSGAELYDPATGLWVTTASMNSNRTDAVATLLMDGKVLVVGAFAPLPNRPRVSAELYDVGLSFNASWQPQIGSLASPLNLGSSLSLTGTQFRGVAEGSSGNSQDSPGDYPLVQLRSLESGQTTFLPATNWSATSFTSLPVWNFPPGWALATVFVNGIASTSSVVNISVPIPTATTLTGARRLTNGAFQCDFTNAVGALFGVLAGTNVASPSSNWTALGGVAEMSPGQFQFTDAQAATNTQRFYRLRSP